MVGRDCKRMFTESTDRTWICNAVTVITCISLMGWIYACIPEPQTATPTLLDKSEIKRLTTQALAEQTALINAEMERRAKGKKHE